MKIINRVVVVVACLLIIVSSVFAQETKVSAVYQVSTLQALLAGEYDGVVSIAHMLKKGDMGLGTFDKLAGEMIVWDGVVYQGMIDGKVYVVEPEETVPFANVATMDGSTKEVSLSFQGGYEELKKEINRVFPRENVPVLFCISGDFEDLSYRSVPAQEKPYMPLVEVVKKQVVFEKKSIRGILVGFRFPSYMAGINIDGFHLHFLSDEKTLGGHLFGVESGRIKVKAQSLNGLDVFLPETIKSAGIDKVDSKKDVEAVEKLEK